MVARVLEKEAKELYLDVLPRATSKAFLKLSQDADWLKTGGWYLAGGTALALQVRHRASVDLDFFSKKRMFDTADMEDNLSRAGSWQTTLQKSGTLYGTFLGAKASFIAYPFFLPSKEKLHYGAVTLLTPDDIAVMKIIAISQRGRKRDFVDLYWYGNNYGDLEAVFYRVLKQYPQKHNMTHILKSLTYFDDAESDPMPNLNFAASWQEIKAYFRREAPRLARKLLGLD